MWPALVEPQMPSPFRHAKPDSSARCRRIDMPDGPCAESKHSFKLQDARRLQKTSVGAMRSTPLQRRPLSIPTISFYGVAELIFALIRLILSFTCVSTGLTRCVEFSPAS